MNTTLELKRMDDLELMMESIGLPEIGTPLSGSERRLVRIARWGVTVNRRMKGKILFADNGGWMLPEHAQKALHAQRLAMHARSHRKRRKWSNVCDRLITKFRLPNAQTLPTEGAATDP